MEQEKSTQRTIKDKGNELKIEKLSRMKKINTPTRFSVRGLRRHTGIIVSRTPKIGFQ